MFQIDVLILFARNTHIQNPCTWSWHYSHIIQIWSYIQFNDEQALEDYNYNCDLK